MEEATARGCSHRRPLLQNNRNVCDLSTIPLPLGEGGRRRLPFLLVYGCQERVSVAIPLPKGEGWVRGKELFELRPFLAAENQVPTRCCA